MRNPVGFLFVGKDVLSTSKIEWTEVTWNPVTGCTKISDGCRHCYAERMARRLKAMGQRNYRNGFDVVCHPHMLERPLSWKSPRAVFVNSMGDLFHEEVPDDFIKEVFSVMLRAHWHRFQVLTKRAERLKEFSAKLDWPGNVWMGVTVETADCLGRIDCLGATAAKVKFLSLEPLLGPLPDIDLAGIDWVIVGGESGPGARPMKEEWVLSIKERCEVGGVAFFFKQWGGTNKKKTGRELLGQTWDQMPDVSKG